ncbi:hypothetical protein JMM59_18655 [Rhodovulum sulfidophilum]|nr:hypothetical protein [Rhodovulum sulfidophilum]MBL3567017.1 hypothetical protein [Rhodovulum sulfidophilum]
MTGDICPVRKMPPPVSLFSNPDMIPGLCTGPVAPIFACENRDAGQGD